MGESADDIGADISQVRELVENGGIGRVLRKIDYALYEAQYELAVEIAVEAYLWLAVENRDPREIDTLTLYVEDGLEELAAAVPDSYYFGRLAEEDDATRYRIRIDDGGYVELYFGQTHGGERVAVPTSHDYLTVYVPSEETYVQYHRDRDMA